MGELLRTHRDDPHGGAMMSDHALDDRAEAFVARIRDKHGLSSCQPTGPWLRQADAAHFFARRQGCLTKSILHEGEAGRGTCSGAPARPRCHCLAVDASAMPITRFLHA